MRRPPILAALMVAAALAAACGGTGDTTGTTSGTSTGTGGSGGTGGGAVSGAARASELVSGGDVIRSGTYRMVCTVGQPSILTEQIGSQSFSIRGGLVGASGSP